MTRNEILALADKYITKDRAATHGDAEDSFAQIWRLWSEYLDCEPDFITAKDVAILMVLFKVARFRKNPGHADNAIDMAGYAALAGEMGTGI